MIIQAVILVPVFILYVVKVTCFSEKEEPTDDGSSDDGSSDDERAFDAGSVSVGDERSSSTGSVSGDDEPSTNEGCTKYDGETHEPFEMLTEQLDTVISELKETLNTEDKKKTD